MTTSTQTRVALQLLSLQAAQARPDRRMKPADLAERVGVSIPTLTKVECGASIGFGALHPGGSR